MNWIQGRLYSWILSGWLVAAMFAGQVRADCFTIFPNPAHYSTDVICTNGANASQTTEFQGLFFVPNGGACDSCTLTNVTITSTNCIVLNYSASPPVLPGSGGLAVLQVTIRPLPGFTNAQVNVQLPCYSAGFSFTFQDPALPAFVTPPSGQNVFVGDKTGFSVDVCGASGYQWQKDGAPLTNNTHLSGADTPNLIIFNTQMADAGDYTVTATNTVGSTSSATGTLTVSDPSATFDPPTITNGFQLSISSVPDLAYVIQTATNLNSTNWLSICTNIAPFIYIDDPSNNAARRFYRAVYVPTL